LRPAASKRVIGQKLIQPRKKMVLEEEERSIITYAFAMPGIIQDFLKYLYWFKRYDFNTAK